MFLYTVLLLYIMIVLTNQSTWDNTPMNFQYSHHSSIKMADVVYFSSHELVTFLFKIDDACLSKCI